MMIHGNMFVAQHPPSSCASLMNDGMLHSVNILYAPRAGSGIKPFIYTD
jgi:hypothetical protein